MMKKLRLVLDDLSVESFGTHQDEDVRGTVAGLNVPATPPYTASCDGSCANTCVSCVNTCLNTCQNSCYAYDTCMTCHTCEFHCTHISICPPLEA
jgi:hypothetical protein